MKQKSLLKTLFLLLFALVAGSGSTWADTYEQLTSIANIDEGAQYVLGIDGTGFHYEGTSNWGKTALPSVYEPIYYRLAKSSDGNSFTATALIGSTLYYLQIPTSNNTFSMATSSGTNTDLIIGTTQVSGTNYAVANKTTTARHLRINGTSGLRSYAGTTGTMAFFYKVVGFTITPQSNSTNYGTVLLNGKTITATPENGYRVSTTNPYTVSPAGSATVEQNGNDFTVTATANTTVTINFEAIPTHVISWSVNGTITTEDVQENVSIEFPTPTTGIPAGYTFIGWSENEILTPTNEQPEKVESATCTADKTYYAILAKAISGTERKTDVLDASFTGVSGSSYSSWSNKKGSSKAIYAGKSTKDGTYIQLNDKQCSGIVTTESHGKIKKVTVTWGTNTVNGRELYVYGKNSLYSSDDIGSNGRGLYSTNNRGTLLGSLVNGTSTELAITEDYSYIGFRPNTGAMYITVSIEWECPTTTYSDYCTTLPVEVTVSSAGLATFACDNALDYTNVSGLEAYIAQEENGTIALLKKNKVPAGTGVLLRATDGGTSFNVPVASGTMDDVEGNLFVRGTGATVASEVTVNSATKYNYILNVVNNKLGFYKANNQTVATNRAYLQTSVAAEARVDINFGENSGIVTVSREATASNRYYDLQGRSVMQPTKGLYIVNGKKVVVK